jgi:hypothetical protein
MIKFCENLDPGMDLKLFLGMILVSVCGLLLFFLTIFALFAKNALDRIERHVSHAS